MWVGTQHQYRISALVSNTSFRGETSGKHKRLFSDMRLLTPFNISDRKLCKAICQNSNWDSYDPSLSMMCFPELHCSKTVIKE